MTLEKFSPKQKKKDEVSHQGKVGDVEVKNRLTRALNHFLESIRERRRSFAGLEGEVRKILIRGTERARHQAREILNKAKEAMSLVLWENSKAST